MSSEHGAPGSDLGDGANLCACSGDLECARPYPDPWAWRERERECVATSAGCCDPISTVRDHLGTLKRTGFLASIGACGGVLNAGWRWWICCRRQTSIVCAIGRTSIVHCWRNRVQAWDCDGVAYVDGCLGLQGSTPIESASASVGGLCRL